MHEPGKETGIQVIRPNPGGTVLSYYSGIVTDQYTGGNHCLKLRQWGAHVAYLDGARRIPSAELHSTPMQLVNHKCEENSNCLARVVDFDDDPGGLGLLVLEAKHDLSAGVFLSFDYRGDFFHRHVPGSVTPPGYKRVRCSCGMNAVIPMTLSALKRPLISCFYPPDPLLTMRLVARQIGLGGELPMLLFLAQSVQALWEGQTRGQTGF